MNHKLPVCVVVIVQTRLVLGKNKVGLEADHVMQEPSELVHLALHNNVRARVVVQVLLVLINVFLEILTLLCEILDLVAQLEHGEEILLFRQVFLLRDAFRELLVECTEGAQGFLGEVLRRGLVLLDTLEVLDCEECLLSLLVNNGFELVVLMLHLLDDFLLNAFLLHHRVFHV